MCCFQQFNVIAPALAFPPFGMSAIVFWMYVCALLVSIIGLIKIFGELQQERGADKIIPFGRLFFAIPLAVFGSEHFTVTASIAALVPAGLRARFWGLSVGGLSLRGAHAVLVKARLAAALVGMSHLIFV
jgi:hypothetical protein